MSWSTYTTGASSSPEAQDEPHVVTVSFFDRTSPNPKIPKKFGLRANDSVRVGRDPKVSQWVIDSPEISRTQLEFYTICFDPNTNPMVFVRDLCSTNGTYVRRELVGIGPDVTPGRLLKNGDTITMGDLEPRDHKYGFKVKMTAPVTTKTLTPLQLQEAKQFREYTITDTVIGYGGTATVYLAYHTKTKKQIACKIYDLSKATAKEVLKITSGLKLSMDLQHPNITSFIRAAKSDNNLYIFEEFATGGDLYTMLDKNSFTEQQIQYMMTQVLRGVKYIHEQGVIHRDIKVENVLCMTYAESKHRLALTDFGHAGRPGRRREQVGTSGWQAPEILQSDGKHGRPIDMWAMGIMAVYLLNGRYQCVALNALAQAIEDDPYVETVELEGIFKKIFHEINTSRQESADNHEAREDFIRRCLNTDPARRLTARAALTHPWFNQSQLMIRRFELGHWNNLKSWVPRETHKDPIIALIDIVEFAKQEQLEAEERAKVKAEKRKKREEREKIAKLKRKVASDTFGRLPGTRKRTAAAAGLADETSPYFSNVVVSENPDPYRGMTSPAGKTKSPSQTCKDMSMKERERQFGPKGHTYRGMMEPALLEKHLPDIRGERSPGHKAGKRKAKKEQAKREEKKKRLSKRRIVLDSGDEGEEEEEQEPRPSKKRRVA